MLTRYPYEFKFDLEDYGIDFNEISSYDMFLILAKQYELSTIINYLNFLFNDEFYFIDNSFVSYKGRVNEDSIKEIREVLYKIFFFDKPKERMPANDAAKKLIKRQIKLNKNKKLMYDIYSMMYGIVNSKNSVETYNTLTERTIHQIYASYVYIKKHDDFDNTMRGIYSGVVKSENIDIEKINWINKIN